jgi:hypothetical protein
MAAKKVILDTDIGSDVDVCVAVDSRRFERFLVDRLAS